MTVDDLIQSESTTISAAQVVFTNVEAEQSPTGHRGFQTVFYTTNRIDKKVLENEIEPAIQYFPRNAYDPETSPSEFLFFVLSTGQVVVGRITPLLTEVDKFNRSKMLFAHLLVFERTEFRTYLNNDPFAVFDADPFYESYDQAVEKTGARSGAYEFPPMELPTISSKDRFKPDALPDGFRSTTICKNLLLIASAAATPKRETFRLQVRGNPTVFMDFLKGVFRLIPPAFRTSCTFDTAYISDSGKMKAASVRRWAVGIGDGQKLKDETTIPVDLNSGQSRLEGVQLPPVTPFENWLTNVTKRDLCFSDEEVDRIHSASLLQELTWGQISEPAHHIDDVVFRQFLKVNEEYILALLRKNFSRFPGPELANTLADCALAWIAKNGPSALPSVPRQFSADMICGWLIPQFEKQPTHRPDEKELAAISAVVQSLKATKKPFTTNERQLGIYFCRWNRDLQGLEEWILNSSESEFERHAEWILRSLDGKISKWSYFRKKFGLFFGFGTDGNATGDTGILRTLTGEAPNSDSRNSDKYLDAGYRRKTVLRLMWKLSVSKTASKKNGAHRRLESNNESDASDLQQVPTGTSHRSRQREVLPIAVLYEDNIIVSQRMQQLNDSQTAFLRDVMLGLCDGGGQQVAFLAWGHSFVVALVDGESRIPSGWLWLLREEQLAEYDNNPFEFLKCQPALAEFAADLLSRSEDGRFELSIPLPAVQRLLLLASRQHALAVRGTGPTVAQELEQLFSLLPIAVRPSCTFSTCRVPDESSFSVWLQGCSSEAVPPIPIYDPQNSIIAPFPNISARTPYEVCVIRAPQHAEWNEIWPSRQEIFNDFYLLSELLQPQRDTGAKQLLKRWTDADEGRETDSVFSTVLRVFAELNKQEIRESDAKFRDHEEYFKNRIQRMLSRINYSEEYSRIIAVEVAEYIMTHFPVSIQLLWNLDTSAIVQLMVENWTTGVSGIPEDSKLNAFHNVNARTVGDHSANALLLRMFLSAFDRDWNKLSFLVSSLERRDDCDDLFHTLARSLCHMFPPADCEFVCDPEGDTHAVVGVEIDLMNAGSKLSESGQMICSLFGARSIQDVTDGRVEQELEPGITGRFWPDLFGFLLDSLSHEGTNHA